MSQPVFAIFMSKSDTNRAVQPQKIARNFKFRIHEVEELYCLCSKNKGSDHLCGYRTADMRKLGFLITRLILRVSYQNRLDSYKSVQQQRRGTCMVFQI